MPAPRAPRRPPSRRLLAIIVAAVVAVLVVGGMLVFGPIVRGRIASEAERRKLDVEVGGVRPGFFAVTLSDVRVRPHGIGIEARFDAIRVDLGATLSPSDVRASGGRITVEGEPEDLVRQLRELRGSEGGASTGTSARKLPVRAENLSLSWKLPSGGELTGSGLGAGRDENGIRLTCGTCSARHKQQSAEATGAEIELTAEGGLQRVEVATLVVTQASSAPPKPAPGTTTASSAEPAPPPLPVLSRRGAKGKAVVAAPPVPPPSGPVLPLPDLHALRGRIATAVAAFAPRIPDGGAIEVGGLSLKLDIGGETMAFGPGKFSLSRNGERVHLAFASAEGAAGTSPRGTPLSIDADLPVGAGEMTARLAGGPVSLAVLGVQEGMKGLTEVSKGTVSGKGQLVLSASADALTFDGSVSLKSIALKQPKLALDVLRGIDLEVAGRGVLDDHGKLRLDDAQIDMGALHVRTHGTVEETADHFAVALGLDVAPAACHSLLASAPEGLLPLVRSARMAGTFTASINLAFDTRTIDKLALDYRIGDECRMVEVPRDLSRDHFSGSFTYRTYKPDGSIGETTTGPGTPSWTAFDDISPFMMTAVLTTEDGAFYKHKGFNHAAIRSSVQANLKARRFVRGASTISMQLAKNLFLARDKALSRKIEEVVLTDYLEQIFRKDDIMELYLNVVEFGPDVYGITRAAEYYFGRKPEELNVSECFFLATLLPSPIRYGRLRDKGEVPETWMRHLHTLMEIAARNGKISRAELDEGLKERVVFVRPGDPRPEPRKPVTSSRRDPSDDDAAWTPLE